MDGEPVTTATLTVEARAALLPMWALYQIESHTPTVHSSGYSCDELGCMICNGGHEAIEAMVEAATTGIDQGPDQPRYTIEHPDDDELIEALGELAVMWCEP